MCDTLVKINSDSLIFGKNSDRSPNEPNLTLFYPKKTHSESTVKCTYLTIDQVPKTHAVLLVTPSWMWGAEMGINDQGVIIGNEAVFTKSAGKKIERLTGMDLLRLALERGNDAKSSLEIIISLLEKYGQGGNCGFDKPFFYDNSFLIADGKTAFILETSGKDWVSKTITDHGNISNRLSLSNEFDLSSSSQNANFSSKNREPIFTFFSGSGVRQSCGFQNLQTILPFTTQSMMEALRSHREQDAKNLYTKGSIKSVCMHKSFLGDHTTGSMIVNHRKPFSTIWITGSSTPCLSLYKPIYFETIVPPLFHDKQQSLAYWLKREHLVRAIFAGFIDEKAYKANLENLQKQFLDGDEQLMKTNPGKDELVAFSAKCSSLEEAFVDHFLSEAELQKNKTGKLPKMWEEKSRLLGKNVFEPLLKNRIK